MLLTIGVTVAAEHVGHFRRPAGHQGDALALVRRVRLRGRRRVWQVEGAGGGADRSRRNLQVSRSGAQATMAKEQLNGAQIGARFEEVNREGMA